MPRKYIKYTKDLLEPICHQSISYREVLFKLGLRTTGGNYKNLQRNIFKFNIDISHMKHQAANQDKVFVSFESLVKPSSMKKRLIQEGFNCCLHCGVHTWNDRPLILELDHIDGNNRNNKRDNLRLLCPNCHSQTSTFRNQKRC